MTDIGGGRGRRETAAQDGAAALQALAECLRFLACGWTLDPRERSACVAILEAGVPGAPAPDLEAARKIIEQSGQRRLPARARGRAGEFSVRLLKRAEALRGRSTAG